MGNEGLLAQEKELSFDKFTNQFAKEIGMLAVNKVTENNWKAIGVRIIYNNVLVFQYLMDGKKDDIWLKRKEKTVLESGHSSLFVFENKERKEYSSWIDNNSYAICGGGFPIIENGQLKGAICVSGLPHEEDHKLIIDVLSEWRGKKK